MTPATEIEYDDAIPREYEFDDSSYRSRVYQGYGRGPEDVLKLGPNIKDWPAMPPLGANLLLKVAA
jgi:aconitate hydratase